MVIKKTDKVFRTYPKGQGPRCSKCHHPIEKVYVTVRGKGHQHADGECKTPLKKCVVCNGLIGRGGAHDVCINNGQHVPRED